MNASKNILVAVEDSDATDLAVAYIADMLGGRNELDIFLLHVLPSMPASLLEWGGSEDPKIKREALTSMEREQSQWLEQEKQSVQPALERARARLSDGGIPSEKVHVRYTTSTVTPQVAEDCLAVAKANNCGTIVVGRHSLPWYKDMFHHHIGAELARKAHGLAVLIVE